MTRNRAIFLAAAGSLGVLFAGYWFQYVVGLAPCKLCLWQRWPHLIATLLGMGAIAVGGRMLPLAGAVTMAVSAGLGAYHTGVERKWWPGPSSCSGDVAGFRGMTPEQMLDPTLVQPVVLCDQVQWAMFGLSMASYNVLISLGFAVFWLWGLALSRG
ncbi:disulfide bond formation protein B [Rhodovulum euryhalinum]|uniref:Disulfide bond formation protein DsbB n=1 Tax=Rhodovulum euryhalinum TaxID=35805 RepID=A0A4R2KSU5_9RHOB|nr:disulfide bond formation protein B [Rhodovulum euryhalinum]TCO69755.1 disulfide bond formation protein DsbB [Rhodovulum euryhalinum]